MRKGLKDMSQKIDRKANQFDLDNSLKLIEKKYIESLNEIKSHSIEVDKLKKQIRGQQLSIESCVKLMENSELQKNSNYDEKSTDFRINLTELSVNLKR
jgi:hypothetical protein